MSSRASPRASPGATRRAASPSPRKTQSSPRRGREARGGAPEERTPRPLERLWNEELRRQPLPNNIKGKLVPLSEGEIALYRKVKMHENRKLRIQQVRQREKLYAKMLNDKYKKCVRQEFEKRVGAIMEGWEEEQQRAVMERAESTRRERGRPTAHQQAAHATLRRQQKAEEELKKWQVNQLRSVDRSVTATARVVDASAAERARLTRQRRVNVAEGRAERQQAHAWALEHPHEARSPGAGAGGASPPHPREFDRYRYITVDADFQVTRPHTARVGGVPTVEPFERFHRESGARPGSPEFERPRSGPPRIFPREPVREFPTEPSSRYPGGFERARVDPFEYERRSPFLRRGRASLGEDARSPTAAERLALRPAMDLTGYEALAAFGAGAADLPAKSAQQAAAELSQLQLEGHALGAVDSSVARRREADVRAEARGLVAQERQRHEMSEHRRKLEALFDTLEHPLAPFAPDPVVQAAA